MAEGPTNPDIEPDLAAARGGNPEALERLLLTVGPSVRATLDIAPHWRATIDPDDVMQVTYMEVFLRIGQFVGATPASFRSWVAQIARHNLLDAIRALERDKRPPPRRRITPDADEASSGLLAALGATSTTPSRVISAGETRSLIRQALQAMPERYAEAIRCFDLEGLTGPEVAERLGCSRVTAFILRARARDRMRELLGSRSMFRTEFA